jgi:hypothetical protein
MVNFHSVERIEDTKYTSSTQFPVTHLSKLLAPGESLLRTYCVASYRLVHLAQRWDDESGVNFHHCEDDGRGFFVEVGIGDGRGQVVVLRSFVSSVPLDNYVHGVRLAEE